MEEYVFPERLIAHGEEPLGERANVYFKMQTLRNTVDALNDDEREFFSKTSLGKVIDLLNKPAWSASFVLFLLSRQLDVSKPNEIWVLYAGTPVRFSLREFKLVTGLPCGKIPVKPKKRKRGTAGKEVPYYGTLFGLEEDVSVERVIAILNKKTKHVVVDAHERERRLRLAALAIVDGFLLPTHHYPKVIKEHVEMSENLNDFLSYPWGRLSFQMMMKTIKARDVQQLATTSVSVQGLLYALQLVVMAAAPAIQEGNISPVHVDSESYEDISCTLSYSVLRTLSISLGFEWQAITIVV